MGCFRRNPVIEFDKNRKIGCVGKCSLYNHAAGTIPSKQDHHFADRAMIVDGADFTTKRLLNSAATGEADSEAALIDRFQGRLIALAASRLPPDTRLRVDPDDVVQSVCRIFIDRIRSGRLSVDFRGELWQYLVCITVNKIRSLARKHRNNKRSVLNEREHNADTFLSREPTPEDACILVETIEGLLNSLPKEKQKRVIVLRLHGESTCDIAKATEMSVERVRQIVRCAKLILEDGMKKSS